MPLTYFDKNAFTVWGIENGYDLTQPGNIDCADAFSGDSDWETVINSQPTASQPAIAQQENEEFWILSYTYELWTGYEIVINRACLRIPTADWEAFQSAGGGGMSCEQLRECTIDFLEETPLIAEEEMLRDDEDFILWQYKPPETYNELLEEPFDIPFRRMSDIVAMLQVIHHQLNEIIVIQRSEVVGAAFPEWNQVRIENRRPVGIFQACELLPDGKLSGAHYQIQIPWMIDNPDIFLPQVFWIEAGSVQYLRVFEDNSRICVYVATEEEGLRVVDVLTALMEPSRAEIYTDRPTPIRGGTIEEKYKILKYLSYYPPGIKKSRGKWSRLVLDAATFEYPPGFTPVEL